jgi:hypothetical protein
MKYYIACMLSLIAVVYNACAYSQTNLICNPSFEDVDQDALERLNNADFFHPTHFYLWSDNYPNYPSVLGCWERDNDHAIVGTPDDIDGISYPITPGLFPTSDGDIDNYYAHPNYVFVREDADSNLRAFMDNTETSGLSLATNAVGLHGIDLSPPTTKFGENVYATDGDSYVALFDIENRAWATVPSLFTELKYALQKDVEYTFSMDFCQMNLLGYLKDNEGWDNVEHGKIEVYISYDGAPISPRQKICEIMADDNEWDVTTWGFKAERSYTHLLIEFDPIKGQLFAPTSSKIAGVFIDNLKLYETCETPENMCDNANYKRDLLNVQLEEVELESPYAFPEPYSNDPGVLKTIRAYHLENVKRFEMKIYKDLTLVRVIDLWYPESDYFWDGRNDAGDMMPDGNDYKAVINAVSNDCFHISYPDENNFELKHRYSVFNPWNSTNIEDGNAFINGLDNVHFMNVQLYTLSGQLVHEFNLNNPPSSIGLSIPSLETYGGAQNGEVAPGLYRIVVTLSNNCVQSEYEFASVSIGLLPDQGSNSQFYNWSPVPKGDFPCPFNIHYNDNYLAPMNCCEGNLYLHDVEIWNDWDVQIFDTIFAGPNVVFIDGVTNTLIAGEQIVLLPDATGVVINSETILTVGDLNCPLCKHYTIVDPNGDGDDTTGREIVYMQMDSIMKAEPKEMVLYPNPVANGQDIALIAGTESINPDNYQIAMTNMQGVYIPLKVFAVTERMLRFKPTTILSSGAYYLHYESNGVRKTFNVVIR